MAKKRKDASPDNQPPLPFERPGVIRALNVALYITNFLLMHYAWERVSPGDGNIMRLAACWFLSYLLTRVIIEATKIPLRAGLTVAFGAILSFVLLMPKG
ncbi:MAG: hypothetical protein C0624_08930 [Desulfuromonas sp.]|nr:MAG: hypothetical protein C0624_08930 [Desulfuromonas sp.]